MSATYLQSLIDSRASMWERAKGIMDGAAAENRDLSAEERLVEAERLLAGAAIVDVDVEAHRRAAIGEGRRRT